VGIDCRSIARNRCCRRYGSDLAGNTGLLDGSRGHSVCYLVDILNRSHPCNGHHSLAVFPLTGVLPQEKIAAAYGSELILLMLGGFILSAAMERSGAHRRIALGMVNIIAEPAAAELCWGLWSQLRVKHVDIEYRNHADDAAIALAVITQSPDKKLALPLLLAIAYGQQHRGCSTPIGTPPNLVFMQQYESFTGTVVSFSQWMIWGLPVVLLFLPLAGLWLTRHLHYRGELVIPPVGDWRPEERRVLIVLA